MTEVQEVKKCQECRKVRLLIQVAAGTEGRLDGITEAVIEAAVTLPRFLRLR
jgi:hypothetical protein